MGQEFSKLIWQNEGVRDEVEILFSMFELHLDYVFAQFVFSGDFIARREMIDLLMLIKSLIEVRLAAAVAPEHIPVMRLRVIASASLKHRSHQPSLPVHYLVKKLAALLAARCAICLIVSEDRSVALDHLAVGDGPECDQRRDHRPPCRLLLLVIHP